jgi:protein SCO1
MQNLIKFFSVLLLVCLFGCYAKEQKEQLPFYNTPEFTPQWLNATDNSYATIHTIAPFQFTNQEGKVISNKEVQGKIYVANFFFSKCASICPRTNANLKKLAVAFESNPDVLILSHSVTPEADSVAQLASYANKQGIDAKKWWLLTGDKEAIYTIARKSYFADEELGYNRSTRDFLHTENALLIDGKGRIRGVYNATLELEINKLIDHIHLLLNE